MRVSYFYSVAHLPQNKPVFYLSRSKSGCLYCYLNATHWAISGIEVGKSRPAGNLTAYIYSSDVGGTPELYFRLLFFLFVLFLKPLLGTNLFLRFFLPVNFLLFLNFLLNSGKLTDRTAGRNTQTSFFYCLSPSAKSFDYQLPTDDFLFSWRVMQSFRLLTYIGNQLFIRIKCVISRKVPLLIFQSLGYHSSDYRLINIISARFRYIFLFRNNFQ